MVTRGRRGSDGARRGPARAPPSSPGGPRGAGSARPLGCAGALAPRPPPPRPRRLSPHLQPNVTYVTMKSRVTGFKALDSLL